MHTFISWFQKKHPEMIVAMQKSSHNLTANNPNPFHLEDDVWSHTMLVCKMAEVFKYDNVIKVASLLHDIGKPSARTVVEDRGIVHFYGHEKLSSRLAGSILFEMSDDNLIKKEDIPMILTIIEHHNLFHQVKTYEDITEELKTRGLLFKETFLNLLCLARCDHQGRFHCTDSDFDNISIIALSVAEDLLL